MESIQLALDQIPFLKVPMIEARDILDMFVVAFVIYRLIIWIKDTRTWALLKGLASLGLIALAAYIIGLNTVWFIISNLTTFGIIAILVLFQPELRRALEQLGQGKILSSILSMNEKEEAEGLEDDIIVSIAKATMQMAKVKTGALIVIEEKINLEDIVRTGIPIDAVISSELLVNIFEKNTPLHDGAVVICKNRITAATCLLPLSDNNQISKELGTRHRAAIGITEISDAGVIVVSEETGNVSYVKNGHIKRDLNAESVIKILGSSKNKPINQIKLPRWKVKNKHE
ncbi:TIGR00159 family protein [Candidatus Epulonipiscium fishelsonii]|uniref:TIGR00159 family protein n=1 Tax=Candidatus Epulonipiscium fishelsonii TaxID=77094 RepID=A0ACC8XGC9_9FIRM|nr:TIGR00159 family protein [Epulopiscium sp. SCG-B11WGA-EpuloA1]ONI42968.1 TIGR00159 family protein [Epulopiscium sp. SCG-B05WGA-EpuloA1]